jgi:DNA mismatch repair ATPase MutS
LLQGGALWDLHVLAAFERWQAQAGPHVRGWLATLGEIEALAALAGLAFDEPTWVTPDFDPAAASYQAAALGHPLLPDDARVTNDVTVGPPGTFLLVTGSNMSGKSTLLRAIGVNAVLAAAGGPACAQALTLPPVELWTSVRVQDSLERGVSFFLAELRRLKLVLDAARRARRAGTAPVLYLLDEILQGTNTAERQVAARRIIADLVAQGAIGAVSTHDLALADAPELAASAAPVHFTDLVGDGVAAPLMSFDYRLRPGVATTTNALRLMQLVGFDDDRDAANDGAERSRAPSAMGRSVE